MLGTRPTGQLPPAPRGEAKAAGINSSIQVLRQMVPAETFAAFLEQLPPNLADLVRRPPVATAWVPLAISVPFYERAYRELFGGSDERMFELGRRQSREDLSTIYRFFVRIASPSFVAARAAQLWGTYARDAGTMRLTRNDDRVAELLVEDYGAASAPVWPYLCGMVHGILELTKVAGIRVTIVEGGGASNHARLRVTWH